MSKPATPLDPRAVGVIPIPRERGKSMLPRLLAELLPPRPARRPEKVRTWFNEAYPPAALA